MKKMRKLSFLFIAFTYISCSNKCDENFQDISKIQKGMNIKQVREIMRNNYMGQISVKYDSSLFLERYESCTGASDLYGIVFRKKDSIVVEVGLGD